MSRNVTRVNLLVLKYRFSRKFTWSNGIRNFDSEDLVRLSVEAPVRPLKITSNSLQHAILNSEFGTFLRLISTWNSFPSELVSLRVALLLSVCITWWWSLLLIGNVESLFLHKFGVSLHCCYFVVEEPHIKFNLLGHGVNKSISVTHLSINWRCLFLLTWTFFFAMYKS